ncbi:hypothetical protein FB446DRAFT_795771, partial [Lentinula raphanica]
MASSSKCPAKRPVPVPVPVPSAPNTVRKRLSIRPVDSLDFEAVHRVHFDRTVREVGKTPSGSDALFLPCSAEECSVLVNNFRHYPNTASPSFSLPRYTHPEEVDFKAVTEQDTNDARITTFYPPQLTTFCKTFATGPLASAEGFQLYQALAFLQRGLAKIIRGHLAKAEIHRRLIAFTDLPNFSYSLQYYQLYWHGHSNCPLAAALLVILVCEFCEEHLTAQEYSDRVYDARLRDGPGMSLKTRDRLLEDITDLFELQELAIPLPFDPSTREGQLVVTVASQGSRVDQILHPVSRKPELPNPSFRVPDPLPSSTVSPKKRLRPPSPDFGQTSSALTPVPKHCKIRSQFPVAPDPIDVDAEDALDAFRAADTPEVLVLRPSISRAAKTKPKIPEEFRKVPMPVPATKRERSPAETSQSVPATEPPSKKQRRLKTVAKPLPDSPVFLPEDPPSPGGKERLRIQEGEPDYHHGDDSDTTTHTRFLTNPNFHPKTPFSQLIRKAWKVTKELKNFGAFATIGDTTFSLQGLSRFAYASSRFLWPANNRTLPSPESLYSTNNCLTCITRGEVCESSEKHGGPCRQCNGTHRSCPSCLSLEDHRDRFLALHKHVQGYPDGYAASLDQYATALDRITKLQASFVPLFQDARQELLKGMQKVQDTSFDLNVVLSRWADDNPDLPLDYDTLTWLATLFGWNSACNLADYLSTPEDLPRLEEFMREQLPPPSGPSESTGSGTSRPPKSPSPTSPLSSALGPEGSLLKSRRRPAAAVPSNFHRSPDTRLAPTP